VIAARQRSNPRWRKPTSSPDHADVLTDAADVFVMGGSTRRGGRCAGIGRDVLWAEGWPRDPSADPGHARWHPSSL